MADQPTPCDKLHDALSSIIRDDQAAMVSKWVALVEVIDENGERSMWSLTSDGLPLWDQIGLIEFQSRCLRPEITRDE